MWFDKVIAKIKGCNIFAPHRVSSLFGSVFRSALH